MIYLKIAFRNIFRQRRRSLLTALMLAGGTFLYCFVIGLGDGTYNSIIDIFTRSRTGHIQIHRAGYLDKPSIYLTMSDYTRLTEEIKRVKSYVSSSPRIYAPGLAFVDKKSAGVRIVGLDPLSELKTTRLAAKITAGRFLADNVSNEVILGRSLANILHADTGSEVVLISQAADGSIANDIFKVVGLIGAADDKMERVNCYIHISKAQEFLCLQGRIHEIAVLLSHPSEVDSAVVAIKDSLNDSRLDVASWQRVERDFYNAMTADKSGGDVSMTIIMIILSIGVLNSILMNVLERMREYGVMAALGTSGIGLFSMIVIETVILAVLSSIAGVLAGSIMNYFMSMHGITFSHPLAFEGMEFKSLLGAVTISSIVKPFIVTVSTAFIVSMIAAVRAARISPVKALRSI